MVDRHETKATILDLDGTWLTVNSLHLLIKTGITTLAKEGKFWKTAVLVWWCGLRYLKLISHQNMRRRVSSIILRENKAMTTFRKKAVKAVNGEVATAIEQDIEDGGAVLLATAALEEYVKLIWKGKFVASSADGSDLRGDAKRIAVELWLSQRGLRAGRFFTDHHADIPTAKLVAAQGGEVILVTPSKKSLGAFRQAGLNFTILGE